MATAAKLILLFEAGIIDAVSLNKGLQSLEPPRPADEVKAAPVNIAPREGFQPQQVTGTTKKARQRAAKKTRQKANRKQQQDALAEAFLFNALTEYDAAVPAPEIEAEAQASPATKAVLAELGFAVVRTYKDDEKKTRLRDLRLEVPPDHPSAGDPYAVMELTQPLAVARLAENSREFGGMKVQIGMTFLISKELWEPVLNDDGSTGYETVKYTEEVYRWGPMTTLPAGVTTAELSEFVATSEAKILEEVEKFIQQGSGHGVDSVIELNLKIDRWTPVRGGSYLPTPKWIINKKCCVNVRNTDQDCFRYALTAAVDRPDKHTERPAYYDTVARQGLFDLSGIVMPAMCTDATFKKFEKQNPGYALSVYECPLASKGTCDLQPVYVSDVAVESEARRINLLLLYDGEAGRDETHSGYHYITVTSMPALLRGKSRNEEAHCLRCLHTYAGVGAADRLEAHKSECKGINGGGVQRVKMPKPGDLLEFKDFEKTLRVPFAIYLDFESSLVAVPDAEQPKSCQRAKLEGTTPNTVRLQAHHTNSYNALVVGPNGEKIQEIFYRGADPAKHCLESLTAVGARLKEQLQSHRGCPALTPQQETEFKAADVCHLCGKDGMTKWDGGKPGKTARVRDHCHVTGEYRGAAHSGCNLKARTCYDIPVFVHNLKGYDSHLLMTEMEKVTGDITVIATNSEKYISFKLANLVFKDSCQFLTCSLAKLVENLPRDEFTATTGLANELSIPLGMLQRKGIYPYSWVDHDDKFTHTVLPPIEAFHDDLNDKPCEAEDYEHAIKVWDAARCETFGDYHDLYLRLDVTLLADVFESFRRSAHTTYGLDPAHYYTLPGFSWSALFKHTGVKLELLTDPDMYIACENALRGGVCAVSQRHVRANNERVAGYDASKPTTWLRYDDANNLYGWAMSQKLPARAFTWGDAAAWDAARVLALADDADRGAFLQVDLEYPAELHDKHNDYPICPERMQIPREWLSPYADAVAGENYAPCDKLVPNLRDKTKYWIHYRNLKFALEEGLRLTKVHRVIEFEQEAWMQPYIDFNTTMRTKATSAFEKDMYKLMNNACFGKTMENLRARRDIQVLRVNSRSWTKWVASPSYRGRKNISDGLVVAERARKNLTLNKPIYVGVAVLDLSKLHMWNFWYRELRPQYPSAKLCYTDTDSLVYSVESKTEPDFHGRAGSMFDTSDLPKNNPMHSDDNKKVLGKFKDEAIGIAIAEFVGLRPKLYALRLDGDEYAARGDKSIKLETKKSKGTQSSVVARHIKFEHYLQTLESKVSMRHAQVGFRTEAHRIYTTRTTKTSLSAFDSKRYLHDDGITSYAYGHYAIAAK